MEKDSPVVAFFFRLDSFTNIFFALEKLTVRMSDEVSVFGQLTLRRKLFGGLQFQLCIYFCSVQICHRGMVMQEQLTS